MPDKIDYQIAEMWKMRAELICQMEYNRLVEDMRKARAEYELALRQLAAQKQEAKRLYRLWRY